MLEFAATHRSGSNDEATVGDGLFKRGALLRGCQEIGRSHSRPCFVKGQVVGADDAQMGESEVAHRARRSADIVRIAGSDQDDNDAAEFGRGEQDAILSERSTEFP